MDFTPTEASVDLGGLVRTITESIVTPERTWLGVGVLPPHVQETAERRDAYQQTLQQAGAVQVFSNVQQITPEQIQRLS